ncbi:uncharacterized protein LOC141537454 [Cotesia typhae]|uniref:uncharacterized protein LOC141537454 n=1 Tax=Cotesia typhae TaxID=2053667 RepID=UPI003D69636E
MRRLNKSLWKKIFEKLDFRTFVGLRMVNREFCKEVKKHLYELEVWRFMCYEQTLLDCRTMTMARRFPHELITHQSEVDNQDLWRGTYLSFKKWARIIESPHNNNLMLSASHVGTYITCITTFDKYLLVSFENGLMNCYDHSVIDKNIPVFTVQHSHRILQCEFWYSTNRKGKHSAKVIIVARDRKSHLSFWDLKRKQRIFAGDCKSHNICTGEGRHFCIAEYDGVLTSYELNSEDEIVPGAVYELNLRPKELIANLCIDGKYITAMSMMMKEGKIGTILYFLAAIIKDNRISHFAVEQEKDWIKLPEDLYDIHRLVMPTIIFFFGLADSKIGSTNFYENEWHVYDIQSKLGSQITAVVLHAQILIIGLQNGDIHFFHIENYMDIVNIEERITSSVVTNISSKPIIDLIIMEYQQNPSIIAATEDEVILVSFEF